MPDHQIDVSAFQQPADRFAQLGLYLSHCSIPTVARTILVAGPSARTSSTTLEINDANRGPSDAETQENCTRPGSMPK